MTMPIDLILVRHGQSEQNHILHEARRGDNSLDDLYRATPPSKFRLTDRGREQAKVTGDWLRDQGLGRFDRRYVSDYVRAKETAAYLALDGPNWYVEHGLREREWGELDGMSWEEREDYFQKRSWPTSTDPFYWVPPNGESIAQMSMRVKSLLDTMHRECDDMQVIVVCHGEVMWAFRYLLERMSSQRWMQLESSDEAGVKINNCQVLHYTRRDPETGELTGHLNWMQSMCPSNPENNGPGWLPIDRQTFTNEELLTMAERAPSLLKTSHKKS